jgi:hypothetical protein
LLFEIVCDISYKNRELMEPELSRAVLSSGIAKTVAGGMTIKSYPSIRISLA